MRPVVLALGLALTAGAAHAALNPEYYEEARRSAPNVIILRVSRVDPPRMSVNECQVHGTVRTVERGTLYKKGQTVRIAVACMPPGGEIPSGGVLYRSLDELSRAGHGRAYLSDAGEVVMSQYEPLH